MVRSWIAQENNLAMTFSSPATGRATAPIPSRLGAGGRIARWVGALVASALLLAPLPAAAATGDEPAVPEVTFSMAPANQGLVSSTQQLVLSLSAANPGPDPLAAGEVTIERGARRLTSEAALDAWLDAGTAGGSFVEVSTAETAEVPGQGEDAQTIAVDAADAGLDDLSNGIYPIRATYETDGERLVARSVIVLPRSSSGTAPIGVIVPITAGAISTGLLGSDALAELTGADGELRAQLDAVTATPAILGVDPAIAASIRALGSAAPAEAVTWLEQLMALPNERFALQYGDADLATQIGAGVTAPLKMTTFAPYLDAANFASAEADATPSPTPGVTELPTAEELLDIGATQDAVYWPATGTAGAEVAGALADEDDAALTLLPSSVVTRGDTTARATAGGADLLVYDDAVSTALQDASSTTSPVDRAALLAALTARSTLHDGAPMLVTLDRAEGRSSEAMRESILAVAGFPSRLAVGLTALADATPARVTLDEIEPDADRVETLAAFLDAAPDLQQISSVLEDPDLLLSNERATVLQLLGNAWLRTPDAWSDAATAHQERIDTWSDGVALIPGQDILLAGSNAALQFTVRNDLPWPATVELLTVPNDARLVVQRSTPVTVGGQQTARVQVQVEALVGSGRSSIDLQLRTPTGIQLGDRQTYAVEVQAEWESFAMIALSVLVTALLVFGVVRTVRRRRRGVVRSDGRAG